MNQVMFCLCTIVSLLTVFPRQATSRLVTYVGGSEYESLPSSCQDVIVEVLQSAFYFDSRFNDQKLLLDLTAEGLDMLVLITYVITGGNAVARVGTVTFVNANGRELQQVFSEDIPNARLDYWKKCEFSTLDQAVQDAMVAMCDSRAIQLMFKTANRFNVNPFNKYGIIATVSKVSPTDPQIHVVTYGIGVMGKK